MKFKYDWKNQTIQQMSIAALFGLVLGLLCLFLDPQFVVISVLGLVGAIILIKYPEFAILIIVIFLSTVLSEEKMPVVNIGPLRLYITDIVLLWLFVILLVRLLIDPEYLIQFNNITIPLLLFFLWSVSGTVIRLLQSDLILGSAIQEFRIISYYLLFFLIINLVKDKKQLDRLLNGLFLLATLTALTNLTQYALGQNFTFLSGRVETFSADNPLFGNVTRITDNPGEGLITSSFIILTVKFFISQFKFKNLFQYLQWGIIGGALLISFNRTHWGVAALSVLIIFFLTAPPQRKKIMTWILYLSLTIPLFLVPALIAPQSAYGQLINAALLRVSTMLSPEAYISATDSTIIWRNFEYQYGIPQIAQHPIFGLGLGAQYRPLIDSIDHVNFLGQHYTHNGHLWIAMKTGLVGWFFFLTFIITYIVDGFNKWRSIHDIHLQSIFLGSTLVGFSILLAAILHPIVMTIFWTPLIGIMIGINSVILNLNPPAETTVEEAIIPNVLPQEFSKTD